jgi:hypothetical protein
MEGPAPTTTNTTAEYETREVTEEDRARVARESLERELQHVRIPAAILRRDSETLP